VACPTLLRRRAQLALLEQACRQQVCATLRPRRPSATDEPVQLVGVQRDGVLVRCAAAHAGREELVGQSVEVRFEYEGTPYVFFAGVRGLARRVVGGERTELLLRLSLPLRLEAVCRRQQVRLTLAGQPPVRGTFTHVMDARRQFEGVLTDVTDGGVGVVVRAAEAPRLHTGDLFWLDVQPPEQAQRWELVVRLVHLRPVDDSDRLAIGWAFQPADDLRHYEGYRRWLQTLAASRCTPEGQAADD